ncbi:3,4-dihydroxy-2-butanone-4-phosphate synthase, partial [Aliarcobacter butzleri]|uniref:3,4-dihydroxy-2-butanone-4-phosphate synthase n=1 Tax=Aliarcobacter butzleri TaxID=28197 RepID=UPI003AF56088
MNLPMMVQSNHSKFQTPFTISIASKEDISTGVTAQDRLSTIHSALKKDGLTHIISPGHIFPLCAKDGGVLERT